MGRSGGGQRFLGIGEEAPPPAGPEDPDLKAAMIAQGRAASFRFRVNLWARLTGRGPFDWEGFEGKLQEAEFRSFATPREASRSVGWSGLTTAGDKWLFGIVGYRMPLLGKSIMRHELFHAAQDFKTSLFSRESSFVRSLAAEYSAHLWGGPLLGVPLAYGGTVCIVVGILFIIYALAGAL